MEKEERKMKSLSVNLSYPHNDEFDITTRFEVINFDKEREKDLMTDNGFVVSDFQGIKKDLKDPNGIFSKKYGQTLKDLNPYADRYKCDCGFTKSRINFNTTCPLCGTKVKYVDDDFGYFGWIILRHDHYIQPLMYRKIEYFIGKQTFESILTYSREDDIDGKELPFESTDPSQPYKNAGIKYFEEHFQEIMDFYLAQKPSKQSIYDDIMRDKEKVFTKSIPVYTTLLRPFDVEGKSFYHEDANPKFNIINKNTTKLNNRSLSLEKEGEVVEGLLKGLQNTINELYTYITTILTGKKGNIRQLFGGRYNFSSRCVIVADNKLRIDQVKLPYKCLIIWLDAQIKNILVKSYNMTYNEAEEYVFKAQVNPDKTVANIIMSIIRSHKEGLPVIINRNPSINFGSMLQMFCVGMNEDWNSDYTMSIPLQILPLLAADFDKVPCMRFVGI